VLDSSRTAERRPGSSSSSGSRARRRSGAGGPAADFSGPYVAAGPYEREDGTRYEVRLERVPGGVRLASWSGGRLERRAPELRADDLAGLIAQARERELLPERDIAALENAVAANPSADGASNGDGAGASPGRAGDMREELRVEPRADGMVRVARWLLFPSRGWELQEAPPILPAARYAEALRALNG
jgi:hypothetical protein